MQKFIASAAASIVAAREDGFLAAADARQLNVELFGYTNKCGHEVITTGVNFPFKQGRMSQRLYYEVDEAEGLRHYNGPGCAWACGQSDATQSGECTFEVCLEECTHKSRHACTGGDCTEFACGLWKEQIQQDPSTWRGMWISKKTKEDSNVSRYCMTTDYRQLDETRQLGTLTESSACGFQKEMERGMMWHHYQAPHPLPPTFYKYEPNLGRVYSGEGCAYFCGKMDPNVCGMGECMAHCCSGQPAGELGCAADQGVARGKACTLWNEKFARFPENIPGAIKLELSDLPDSNVYQACNIDRTGETTCDAFLKTDVNFCFNKGQFGSIDKLQDTCKGAMCTKQECCQATPTCYEYLGRNPDFCANNDMEDDDASKSTTCSGAHCTKNECCTARRALDEVDAVDV